MPPILIVPGYTGSGPDHWQSLWERALPGTTRVEQRDWDAPDREEWVAALHRAIAAAEQPPVVVAHSLGCLAVVHWAAVHGLPLAGALLVAPPDVERAGTPEVLRGFAPIPMRPLGFPSTVVASTDDPHASPERSEAFAEAWGSHFVSVGAAGHINTAAGFGPWREGERLLGRFLAREAGSGADPARDATAAGDPPRAVVLDTNLFVAAGFNPSSASARILAAVRDERLRMVWSEATRREIEFVLGRIPPLRGQDHALLFRAADRFHDAIHPERFGYVPDPDDRKFAALAHAAGAVLLSNDAHLLGVEHGPGLTVLTPGDFWRSISIAGGEPEER